MEDLVDDSEAVVVEAVAVSEVDEMEDDLRCLRQLVLSVVMIVRFLSNLPVNVQFTAVTVLET